MENTNKLGGGGDRVVERGGDGEEERGQRGGEGMERRRGDRGEGRGWRGGEGTEGKKGDGREGGGRRVNEFPVRSIHMHKCRCVLANRYTQSYVHTTTGTCNVELHTCL